MHIMDYWRSRRLKQEDFPFYAALAYLIQKADSNNLRKLLEVWPEEVEEIQMRYNTPAGAITEDEERLAKGLFDQGLMNSFGEVKEIALKWANYGG